MWGGVFAALLAFSVPPGAARTPIAVTADDGVALAAVAYRSDPAAHRRTVVVTPDGAADLGAPQADALAEALFYRGLDVVVWSRRGTGASGGDRRGGTRDAADLLAVIDAVDRHTFARDIGLFGVGAGAAASFEAAARTARVKALALYGFGLHGAPAEPPGAFAKLYLRLQGVRLGESVEAPPADTAALARRLQRRPVFVMAGGRDPRVSRDDALALYARLVPPKEWGFAPHAGENPPVAEIAGKAADFFSRRLR